MPRPLMLASAGVGQTRQAEHRAPGWEGLGAAGLPSPGMGLPSLAAASPSCAVCPNFVRAGGMMQQGSQLPEGVTKGARPTSPFGPKGGGLPNRHLRTGAWPLLTAGGLVGVGRHGRCRNRD